MVAVAAVAEREGMGLGRLYVAIKGQISLSGSCTLRKQGLGVAVSIGGWSCGSVARVPAFLWKMCEKTCVAQFFSSILPIAESDL